MIEIMVFIMINIVMNNNDCSNDNDDNDNRNNNNYQCKNGRHCFETMNNFSSSRMYDNEFSR